MRGYHAQPKVPPGFPTIFSFDKTQRKKQYFLFQIIRALVWMFAFLVTGRCPCYREHSVLVLINSASYILPMSVIGAAMPKVQRNIKTQDYVLWRKCKEIYREWSIWETASLRCLVSCRFFIAGNINALLFPEL